MATTFKLDLSFWNVGIYKVFSNLEQKDDLMKKAFNIIGIRDINMHFREESGPNGKWEKRSEATNRAYDRIRELLNERKAQLRSSKGRTNADRITNAYARGVTVRSATVGGVPRSAFRSSNRILQLTGNLRKTALVPTVTNVNSTTIKVTSESPYGGAHDEGSQKRGLPKREFMWLSDDAITAMNEAIRDAIIKGGLD